MIKNKVTFVPVAGTGPAAKYFAYPRDQKNSELELPSMMKLSKLGTVITIDKGSYCLAVNTINVFKLGVVEAGGGPDH